MPDLINVKINFWTTNFQFFLEGVKLDWLQIILCLVLPTSFVATSFIDTVRLKGR